jgi:hypothetical protein
VFPASHLAQVLLEAVAAGENCARQRSGLKLLPVFRSDSPGRGSNCYESSGPAQP